jgi:hypothetical protein
MMLLLTDYNVVKVIPNGRRLCFDQEMNLFTASLVLIVLRFGFVKTASLLRKW